MLPDNSTTAVSDVTPKHSAGVIYPRERSNTT
jgi:hypothetical protein